MELVWYEVEKFAPNEDGKLVHTITWIFNAAGEIVSFELGDDAEQEALRVDDDCSAWIDWDSKYGSNHLTHVPVPFDFGDIITIDMRPYYDKLNGVIVRLGDNHDCCAVACIYADGDGYLYCGTLKHNLHGTLTKVSPLYRAARFSDELSGNEAMLKVISEAIKKVASTTEATEGGRVWHHHALAELFEDYLKSDSYERKNGRSGCSCDDFKLCFAHLLET